MLYLSTILNSSMVVQKVRRCNMYKVVNDAGNVYVYDADDNIVSFKDQDVLLAIKNDNTIITGDEGVQDIIDYANNYEEPVFDEEGTELQKAVEVPWYLQPDELAKTSVAPEDQ